MIVLRMGWRNVWRNPRRSLITIAGIAFAFAFLIALVGLSTGIIVQLLRNGTELMVGHVQIHDGQYLPDRDMYETIGDAEGMDWRAVLVRLEQSDQVVAASPRVFGFGLLSTGDRSAGAQIVGVDPELESDVSRIVDAGSLAALQPGSLLLGELLAQELGAHPGDEIAAVTQAADGTLGNELFTVSRTVRTGLPFLDRTLAFARIEDLQRLLAFEPTRIHEIAVRIQDPMTAPEVSRQIARIDGLPRDVSVQSWRDLLPQLSDYLNVAGGAYAFIIGLVVIFAAFGVLNTMMMATFERIREIGMLSAFGMRASSIVITILLEALFLALLGLVAGFLLGLVMMQYLSVRGLDLSRWTGELSMLQARLDPVMKAVWNWEAIAGAAASLCVATVIAAYLPARKAVRVDPVEALHAPVLH